MFPSGFIKGFKFKPALDKSMRLITFSLPEKVRKLFEKGQRSLVNRLLFLLVMGVVLIYFLGIAGLWWTSNRLIQDGLRRHAVQWIVEMEELGVPLYTSKGKKDLPIIEHRIKNFPEVSFVRFYDASGKQVLREYGRYHDQSAPSLSEGQLNRLARMSGDDRPYLFDDSLGKDYVRIISPLRVKSIRSDGLFNFDLKSRQAENIKVIGYVDLGIDPRFYRDQLASTLVLGSIMIATLFFIALILGRRLIKKALTPLMELQTPLAKLARGDIDVSVTTRGDREIAAIGDALNATISALKQRDDILRELAEHDSLTGLFNRHYFSRLLEAEITRVALEHTKSALLFIDLDRFKYVNDTLGHAAGDRLLLQVANSIKGRMREHDVISRFGGDEFTVIARNVSSDGATGVAASINEIMRDIHFVENGQSFDIFCSIGIAIIDENSASATEILSQADAACYEAKSRGRNGFHVYSTDGVYISDIGWSQMIRRALQEDRFKLFYQPIMRLDGRQEEFYEVLLRLPDEGEKMLLPVAFLPSAERFGLLADIDRWVIVNSLNALAALHSQGRKVTLSINLSGQTFEDPGLAQLIVGTLTRHGLPPSAVVFEITEQTAVRYMDKAYELMQGLIAIGCRFALDDFGVGFSSFNYLKRLPISLLKIDGCFIENMAGDATDRVVTRSIVQIAKAMGMQVVAESVQNRSTLALLKEYGVDYAQGHYLGMPAETLLLSRVTMA